MDDRSTHGCTVERSLGQDTKCSSKKIVVLLPDAFKVT